MWRVPMIGEDISFLKSYFDAVRRLGGDRDGLREAVEDCFLDVIGRFDYHLGPMDPFSPLALLLGIGNERDAGEISERLAEALGMGQAAPRTLSRIPSPSMPGPFSRSTEETSALWDLLDASQAPSSSGAGALELAFDRAAALCMPAPDLTVALSWAAPLRFLPVCDNVAAFLSEKGIAIPSPLTGAAYLRLNRDVKALLPEWGLDGPQSLPCGRMDRAAVDRVMDEIFRPVPARPYGEEDLLSDTMLPAREVAAIESMLASKGALILRGPPAVGKTHLARALARRLVGSLDESRVRWAQPHPGFAYEDLLFGRIPDETGRDYIAMGPLAELCDDAMADPDNAYVMVLDGMDGALPASYMGEALPLVAASRRGERVGARYCQVLTVPGNVAFIGTAGAGFAAADQPWMRRLFAVYDMRPMLAEALGPRHARLAEDLGELNSELAGIGPDRVIGHGFFMGGLSVREVVEREVVPVVRAAFADDPDRAESWASRLSEDLRRTTPGIPRRQPAFLFLGGFSTKCSVRLIASEGLGAATRKNARKIILWRPHGRFGNIVHFMKSI